MRHNDTFHIPGNRIKLRYNNASPSLYMAAPSNLLLLLIVLFDTAEHEARLTIDLGAKRGKVSLSEATQERKKGNTMVRSYPSSGNKHTEGMHGTFNVHGVMQCSATAEILADGSILPLIPSKCGRMEQAAIIAKASRLAGVCPPGWKFQGWLTYTHESGAVLEMSTLTRPGKGSCYAYDIHEAEALIQTGLRFLRNS